MGRYCLCGYGGAYFVFQEALMNEKRGAVKEGMEGWKGGVKQKGGREEVTKRRETQSKTHM